MTLPQVMCELGLDRGSHISDAEAAERVKHRRAEIFDQVCVNNGLSADRLLACSPDVLADLVRKVIGDGKPVDATELHRHVREYLAARE